MWCGPGTSLIVGYDFVVPMSDVYSFFTHQEKLTPNLQVSPH